MGTRIRRTLANAMKRCLQSSEKRKKEIPGNGKVRQKEKASWKIERWKLKHKALMIPAYCQSNGQIKQDPRLK